MDARNDAHAPTSLRDALDGRQLRLAGSGLEVSAAVRASWERSLLGGLRPDVARPPFRSTADGDCRLAHLVGRVIADSTEELERSGGCLSLTDADGVILRQWAGDTRMLSLLQDSDLRPGFSASESSIGTTSALTLVSRRPEIVRGPEHFAEQFAGITSSGMVIVHPVSRQVVGSLHLTNPFSDTSCMALNWVSELVRRITRGFLDSATEVERLLMARFLQENRDSRHGVVALNAQTIVMNATASRLLEQVDRATLWESASRVVDRRSRCSTTIESPEGVPVTCECSPIDDDGRTVGVLIRIARPPSRRPHAQSVLPLLRGLEGRAPRWREMHCELAATQSGPVLLVAEPGAGAPAVARAVGSSSSCLEVLAGEADTGAVRTWVRSADPARSSPTYLVMNHLERLAPEDAAATVRLLAECAHEVRVIGTFIGNETDVPPGIRDLFAAVVEVPPLRDRLQDLPDLVAEITGRVLARTQDRRASVAWSSDALQAMTRLDWPANVDSLEDFVARVLAVSSSRRIGLSDLPPRAVALAARRPLVGLERAEADAILRAVRDAQGNKATAAQALGIARSTLYRKVKALGIDLDISIF